MQLDISKPRATVLNVAMFILQWLCSFEMAARDTEARRYQPD